MEFKKHHTNKYFAAHFIVVMFGLLFYSSAFAQYGNEWINYNQPHYRINIPKTGLYRIDSTTLANSGVPLNIINPKNFQLFIKGIEQHVFIQGESDNVFNANDYIEFYAEKNDGVFDSLAYSDITRLPNPYIAMFNDTNYVFLTWNTSLNNKRVALETDINFSSYTPASYFYNNHVTTSNTSYSLGRRFLSVITDPRYVQAEGFGTTIAKGQSAQTNLTNLNVFQSASLPVYLKTSYSGSSEDYVAGGLDHQIVVDYLNSSGNYVTMQDTMFFAQQNIIYSTQFTSNQLQNSSHIRVRSINNPLYSGFNNSTHVHYINLKYPQIPNLAGLAEQILFVDNSSSQSKTFLDLQNVNVGSGTVIFYDLSNHKKITTSVSGNNVKVLVANSIGQKKCFITNTGAINFINSLAPVNQTGYFVNYKTSNPDSAFLIVTHKSLESSANTYKSYRQSPAGGSNHVIMALINDLYDQFAYGNKKNPLAIKNFCRFLSDSLTVPPKYLLLIGKSIKNELVKAGGANWNNSLVPTMGNPSSDNLLTSGIKGTHSSTSFIPVGRVSANTNQQVSWYLDKVISHEQGLRKIEPDDWRKHVLHFAGGTDLYQQQLFQSYLQSYEASIVDTSYGGKVFNFQKTTTSPIQITISDSVKQLINYGASIITFFGHGSVSGFDQAIDDPTIYNNKDKYPLFLANSCYSGDIHTPGYNSASEAFTMIKDKGSIGFIASSSAGVVSPLNIYSSEFYKAISYQRYAAGIGDAMKYSAERNSIYNNQLVDITALEMTLEGDPSVRLNAYKKPDYKITNSYVSFNTSRFVDSIGINIRIRNLGKAVNDSFLVRTERYFPQGDSLSFIKRIKAPYNSDTLTFFIAKDFENGVGLNKFKVYIDSYNEVDELNENNNSTIGTVDLFIPGGDVIPVYPYKYAVIPNTPQVTLKASTADPFALNATYRLQLDTSDAFLNPLSQTIITSAGGVLEWAVNLPYGDSVVYFWRVSKDSILPADNFKWRESSFQVIGTKRGWAQAHFHQFKNNNFRFVKYRKQQRRFDFENDVTSVYCRTGFLSGIAWDQIMYALNGSQKHVWNCAWDGWTVVVFDSTSTQPWQSNSLNPPNAAPGPYANCHCDGTRPLYALDYGTSNFCGFGNTWQNDLLSLFNNLPVNSRVLAYSAQNHQAKSYSNALYSAFESIGSNYIRNLEDTVPLIIFGKKGFAPGQANEVIGANNKSVIVLNDSIKTNWTSGYIASEIIGPSSKWNSLHWKQLSYELPSQDSVRLKLVGITSYGTRDTIASFPADSTDILALYNYVRASDYPYLQLVATMSDKISKTPIHLKKWQVLYEDVPECAINPLKGYTINNDSIQEGDNLIIKLPIENIGQLPFNDSLLVTYWIEDSKRVNHPLPSKLKSNPFTPGQVFIDTIQFTTRNYPGLNYLWVDVNPLNNSRYQSEQYHFNNITRIPFKVSTDKVNPLLDVTFDGTHILNGDIISSKPHILVTLKDENKFLALNDTSDFTLFLKSPNQNSEKRIFFANSLQFTPAQLPNNSCKIEWRPELMDDGKYTLIVQAKDRSRNVSGAVDYNIQFEIINKQTVTEVLNYPNPFSTATRFVFTLTGSEIPDVFTIQIMTITGKVVREITKAELGNIRIGRNISDYVWDGKDDFGDKLANGVYLYKVITRHNGKAIEKRETDADSFFKKGFGKLVIMR